MADQRTLKPKPKPTKHSVATRTRTAKRKSAIKKSEGQKLGFFVSEQLLRIFFELSADAVLVGRRSGVVDYANPAACALFGYTLEEFMQAGGYVTVDMNDPRYYAWLAERRRRGRAFTEMTCVRRDGTRFEAEISSAILNDKNGQVESIVIIRDISERKKAEEEKNRLVEQLRKLMQMEGRAREDERTKVAREIHDEFGQILTALKIDLSLLSRRLLPEQNDLAAKVESMLGLIQQAKENLQRIATELRPGLLDELGLIAAAESHLQQMSERSGLVYEFQVNHEEMEIERDTATALFRILQEALANVVWHARATRVEVDLEEQPDFLSLAIRDNGKGIDPTHSSDSFALGLLGMRERAGALGGAINIQATPGGGTTIIAKIPRAHRQVEDK